MSQDAQGNYVAAIRDETPLYTGPRRQYASGEGGGSGTTTTTSTTTPVGLLPPTVPSQLVGQRNDDFDAFVGCDDFSLDNTGIVQINVYRATVSGGPYALVGNIPDPTSLNVFFDDTLLDTTQYYYTLKTLGDGLVYQAIESDASSEICALLAPQNFASSAPTSEGATVSWDYSAPNPPAGWRFQWSTDESFGTFDEGVLANPLARNFEFFGLDPETQYFVRIRAENASGCVSNWSIADFTTTA